MGSGVIKTGLGSAGARGITIARPDPVMSQRNMWIDQQMSTPAIGANCVSGFLCISNPTSKGIDVSFRITDATGIRSMSLVRAAVMDIAQAIVLQTWTASASAFTWSDTDAILQQTGAAYYWLKMEPLNSNGSEQVAGPQFILLNPSLLPPLAASGISASHAAAVNGTVLVTCNVAGIPAGGSVKVYVTGYEGNPSPVAVAQRTSSPIQFNLAATGETVTITAIAVSAGGAEASSGPTCTLTLTGGATVPAAPQGVTVAQLPTGNQVMWPASLEAGVTGYQLWRGQRGDAFGAASLLATPAASGAGTVIYLDTGGLAGDYQYFVVAVSAAGNSPPSSAANPIVLFSSSQIPPNVGANSSNTAVLDSIAAGSSATLRIYGPGGLGTSYTRQMGYGTPSRPSGSVTGLAYTTRYYVIYSGGVYLASTNYADTLPDGYEYVGTLVTCPSGGGGGATASATAATIAPYPIVSVLPVNQGYGYGTASATITGGGGTGASATPHCSGGQVVSYSLSNQGAGYVSPAGIVVTVTLLTPYTGGGGTSGDGGARYVLSS
jgi:hypothetical protein